MIMNSQLKKTTRPGPYASDVNKSILVQYHFALDVYRSHRAVVPQVDQLLQPLLQRVRLKHIVPVDMFGV